VRSLTSQNKPPVQTLTPHTLRARGVRVWILAGEGRLGGWLSCKELVVVVVGSGGVSCVVVCVLSWYVVTFRSGSGVGSSGRL
jgi:hypothetical protein